jgi:hypothetical protein
MQGVTGPGFVPNLLGAGLGGFQDGDPTNGIVGTELTAALFNDILGNLLGIMSAAGIAPTAARMTDLSDAVKALVQQGHGQCQLQVSSTVQLKLMPRNGQTLKVGGKYYQIPNGGLAVPTTNVEVGGVAAQNLAASTDYLLFVKDDGTNTGVLLPSFYPLAGGHMTDVTAGNLGVEVRNNGGAVDTSRTLVGLVGTDSASHFTNMLTRSWFNRQGVAGGQGGGASTSSNSIVELGTGFRVPFMAWADDLVTLAAFGTSQINNTSETNVWLGVDGAILGNVMKANLNGVQFVGVPFGATWPAGLTEGRHTASLFGSAGTGGTNTILGGNVQVAISR